MCRFASFVLTKNDEYYLETTESHENIIQTFNLKDDEVNVVRVELILPVDRAEILNVSKWTFVVDQDKYPDWTYRDDPTLEEKARKALARRIEEQSIGKVLELGFGRRAIVGPYGKAIVGDLGQAIAGDGGMAIGGTRATAMAGEHAFARVGDYGKSVVEDNGKAIAGNYGKAIAGNRGIAITGDYGKSITRDEGWSSSGTSGTSKTGVYGHARSGEGGRLIIKKYDLFNSDYRDVIGYVGKCDIEPNLYYRLASEDRFEKVPYQY